MTLSRSFSIVLFLSVLIFFVPVTVLVSVESEDESVVDTTVTEEELAQQSHGKKTPSHVYQKAISVKREINLIREVEGVSEKARQPGVQIKKKPIDVYQKAIELIDKLARYQKNEGMEPLEVKKLPFGTLHPEVVVNVTEYILEHLREIKSNLGINKKIEEPSYIPGKTPSDVYKVLWRSSYLFDGLLEPLEPSDVFVKEVKIRDELELLTERLDVETRSTSSTEYEGKVPKDVLMENYVNMYKIARIQRNLGMEPFHVPPLPGGEITPANVYDTALVILGQLHRLKIFKGIEERVEERRLDDDKSPTDVYGIAKSVQSSLDTLLESVEG